MATWPIVKTQRSMPGKTGGTRGSLDYPDDAIRGWREFQKLWDDAGNEWNKRRLKQIDSQITEYKVRYTEEVEKFSASLDKNQDESTYPAELEKFQSNTQTFLPKDPIAAAAAKLYARGKVPFHQKTIRMLQDAKLEDKWFANYGILRADFEQGNTSESEFRAEGMKGVAFGYIKRAQAEKDVRVAGHIAARQGMEVMAGNNPEWWVKNIKNQADMKKYYPKSLPADYPYISGLVTNQINRRKRQEDAAMSAFYTDVSDKAAKGMSFLEMRELIINQPGLTIEEREKAMTVFNSASNTWGEGGTKENPWKTTQDYNALMKMQVKISRGEPVTEMDIWSAQAAQPGKGPLFSRSDGLNLISQLPDNKDPIMKTPFAEEWMNIVDSTFATEKVGDDKVVPEDQLDEWQATRNTIAAIIKENGLDYTKSQKEIKEYLAPIRKKKARKTLSKIWGFATTSPLSTAIKIGKMQLELSKAKERSGE